MDEEDIIRGRYRGTRVCAECVEEDELRAYIQDVDGRVGCSFCEQDDAPTCNFLQLMEHVKECIEAEYDMAANCLAYESAEGGYLWNDIWDTDTLLTDQVGIGLPRDNQGELLEAMVECLGGHADWCDRNPYGEDPLDTLRDGWAKFCQVIQHETRFFLDRWKRLPPPFGVGADPTPAQMLNAIGDHIARLDLFRTLPVDTQLYRVRFCKDGKSCRTPADLGPPPVDKAIVSNRMSPPGIVMFYGALDSDTALAETVDKPGLYTVATFRNRLPLHLCDFTRLPEIPGFFARIPDTRPWERRDAQFFHDLVDDFSRPIERDDRVHIEYIPTQVVTEYLRLQFHHEHGMQPLDGILYPSSRRAGYAAVVLFVDRTVVTGVEPVAPGEPDNTWLELTATQDWNV